VRLGAGCLHDDEDDETFAELFAKHVIQAIRGPISGTARAAIEAHAERFSWDGIETEWLAAFREMLAHEDELVPYASAAEAAE
jgi:hypothetical protein